MRREAEVQNWVGWSGKEEELRELMDTYEYRRIQYRAAVDTQRNYSDGIRNTNLGRDKKCSIGKPLLTNHAIEG